jgi:hypothetical protein
VVTTASQAEAPRPVADAAAKVDVGDVPEDVVIETTPHQPEELFAPTHTPVGAAHELREVDPTDPAAGPAETDVEIGNRATPHVGTEHTDAGRFEQPDVRETLNPPGVAAMREFRPVSVDNLRDGITDLGRAMELPAGEQVRLMEFFTFQRWILDLREAELRVVEPLINDPAFAETRRQLPGSRLCQHLAELADNIERIPNAFSHPGKTLARLSGVPEILGKLADLAIKCVTDPLVEPLVRPIHLIADGLRLLGVITCTHDIHDCPCARALTQEAIAMSISPELTKLRNRYWDQYLAA